MTRSLSPSSISVRRMPEKVCSKCASPRPLTQFRKRKESADGYGYECDPCRSARRRVRYAVDESYKRRILDAQKSRNAANPEANRKKVSEWRKANPERVLAGRREWFRNNREQSNAYQRDWARRNSGTRAACCARRKASKIRATPKWADQSKITLIYKAAAETGMHVDHVVPLQSKLVCGLHCEANLELLPVAENMSKSNRHWPDMP